MSNPSNTQSWDLTPEQELRVEFDSEVATLKVNNKAFKPSLLYLLLI
jgi:hypothetical protein